MTPSQREGREFGQKNGEKKRKTQCARKYRAFPPTRPSVSHLPSPRSLEPTAGNRGGTDVLLGLYALPDNALAVFHSPAAPGGLNSENINIFPQNRPDLVTTSIQIPYPPISTESKTPPAAGIADPKIGTSFLMRRGSGFRFHLSRAACRRTPRL